MPQEPKKRHSRARQGKRRAAIRLSVSQGITCPNCGAIMNPHTICRECGFYKGKEVIKISKTTVRKVKEEKTQEHQHSH